MENETRVLPLTPCYDNVPMPQREPEPEPQEPQPAPCAAESDAHPPTEQKPEEPTPGAEPKQKPSKRKPQRKRQRKAWQGGPLTEVEALRHEVSQLRSKKDVKVLDLQLRVGTLRTFLQSHDLWQPFLAANLWW